MHHNADMALTIDWVAIDAEDPAALAEFWSQARDFDDEPRAG